MHRICLLLLTFLFSLQLLAAEPERAASGLAPVVAATPSGSNLSDWPPAFCAAESPGADWQQPDPETLNAQGDLEDQTLPASLAALLLDWHPFPHSYPLVRDGTPVFMVLLRPPPIV